MCVKLARIQFNNTVNKYNAEALKHNAIWKFVLSHFIDILFVTTLFFINPYTVEQLPFQTKVPKNTFFVLWIDPSSNSLKRSVTKSLKKSKEICQCDEHIEIYVTSQHFLLRKYIVLLFKTFIKHFPFLIAVFYVFLHEQQPIKRTCSNSFLEHAY